MALTLATDQFGTLTIPGTHHAITPANPDAHEQELSQFGNPGVAYINGGFKSATVNVPMLIHNGYATSSALIDVLNDITDFLKATGTLAETVGLQRTWNHVRFDSMDYAKLGSHEDILYTSNLGYVLNVVLGFRFLRPFREQGD